MGETYYLTANSQPRPNDQPTQPETQFKIKSVKLEWSWGNRPAEAMVTFTGEGVLYVGAELLIAVAGHSFYGIAKDPVSTVSSKGNQLVVRFADMRDYLWWDVVFGCFNKTERRLVSGVPVKRWWHILPANYLSGVRTYTSAPLSAAQILDYCFGAPTIGTTWTRVYHTDMNTAPVFDVDCMSGRKLAEVVEHVGSQLGLTFTLMGGKYRLVWTRKGVGALPPFPDKSDERRSGFSIPGNPTRVFLVGDRNLYQVANVDLEPDWKAAWQEFYDVSLLAEWLYTHATDPLTGTPYAQSEGADPEQIVGRQLAAARANVITVGEVAALKNGVSAGTGDPFLDPRRFNGRSRNEMPAALYIRTLLFRAFRVPSSFTLKNAGGQTVPRDALAIVPQTLARVTHDATTGVMTSSATEIPMSDGYAIAKGYRVGSDLFRGFDPSRFKLSEWLAKQDLWTKIDFQLDDSGDNEQFLVFEEPVLRSSDLVDVNNGHAVLKAVPTFTAPSVKAALTFAAERFAWTQGTGSLDESLSVPNLFGEYHAANGAATPVELAYQDGQLASTKAAAIATAFLSRPTIYPSGGYTVRGCNATQLTAMIDRVVVNYSAGGLTEEVDFTTERFRLDWEPERDFERRRSMNRLFPGQDELRRQAEVQRTLGLALRADRTLVKTLIGAFVENFIGPAPLHTVVVESPGSATLAVGTPLFKEPTVGGSSSTKTRAVLPGSTDKDTHKEFAGAVVQDGKVAAGLVPVQKHGQLLLRVMGPVAFGDGVGMDETKTYLKKGGTPSVGRALQVISGAEVKLIKVETSSSGKGQTIGFCDSEGVAYTAEILLLSEPVPV